MLQLVYLTTKVTHNNLELAHQDIIQQSVPCDHLLLLVGGVSTAAQVLAGRGQEVEAVVLKGLVQQGQQNLGNP